MRNIKVQQGQSLLDVAILETGNISNVLSIANATGVAIDAELEGVAVIPAGVEMDMPTVSYLASQSNKIASAISGSDMGGIGAMGIEIDFMVRGDIAVLPPRPPFYPGVDLGGAIPDWGLELKPDLGFKPINPDDLQLIKKNIYGT